MLDPGHTRTARGARPEPRRRRRDAHESPVEAGWEYTAALKKDGTVWVWGDTHVRSYVEPTEVNGLGNVVAVAGGWEHILALRNDGAVWAWGWNFRGELGDGTTANSAVPVQVLSASGSAHLNLFD